MKGNKNRYKSLRKGKYQQVPSNMKIVKLGKVRVCFGSSSRMDNISKDPFSGGDRRAEIWLSRKSLLRIDQREGIPGRVTPQNKTSKN